MEAFKVILLVFLIVCALAVSFSKNLLNSVLIYMAFSLIISVLWMCLESPDLAITEAAVGAGVTTLLFIGCLKKIQAIELTEDEDDDMDSESAMEKINSEVMNHE